MKRTHRFVCLTLALVLAVSWLLLVSCSPSVSTPIRIGVNAWPPAELWYVARAQGFINDEVELVRFSSWRDNMRSMYDGKTDLTHATYFNAAYYADKGEDASIVLVLDTVEGSDGLALHDGAVRSMADGEKIDISVELHTDEHFLLQHAMRDLDIGPDDVRLHDACGEVSARMYITGEVDGTFTYDPFLSEATAEGGGSIVWSTADLPGYMVDVLVARNEVVKSQRARLTRIVAAWYRALEWTRENPREAYEIMAAQEYDDPEDFGDFFEEFRFYTAEENRRLLGDGEIEPKLSEMMSFLRENYLVDYAGPVEDLYTAWFVENLR